MKPKYLLAGVICIFVLVLFVSILSSGTPSATASAKQTPIVDLGLTVQETEEPIKTPENIPTSVPLELLGQRAPEIPVPTLERPHNKTQALQDALAFDRAGAARWDTPWSLDSLSTEPDRIQAELVSLRALEPRIGRFPDMDDEELVWKITIRGSVWLYGIGWSCKCSGVTYLIWPKTGEVFGILSEEPVLEKGFGRGGRP